MSEAPYESGRRYHHGDLPRALLDAAECELSEHGIERFSLRKVAMRAGVSHAAPSHHFRDSAGLLTRLATVGFERFSAAQSGAIREAEEPLERLLDCGHAYVSFALSSPALFRLMFDSDKPDREDAALQRAARQSHSVLRARVAALRGLAHAPAVSVDTAAATAWAMVHGVANLLIGGHLQSVCNLAPADREAAIRAYISPAVSRWAERKSAQ